MSGGKRQNGGFTLLEILIAMAILALLGSALAKQTSSSAQVYSRIDQRTEALLLAENSIEEIQLAGWPALGRSSTVQQSSNQQWAVETLVESTARDDMRKLIVSVRIDGNKPSRANEAPVVQLHAFAGRY